LNEPAVDHASEMPFHPDYSRVLGVVGAQPLVLLRDRAQSAVWAVVGHGGWCGRVGGMSVAIAYILKPFILGVALCFLLVIRYLIARFMPECRLKRIFLTPL
jgi:hypothetical protein